MAKKFLKMGILLLLLAIGVTMILAVPVTASGITPAHMVEVTPLNQVKVASVYERLTDGIAFSRSMNDVITIFNETNTSLIFRSFYRWEAVPDSSTSTMPGYPNDYVTNKNKIGYTYQQLGDSTAQIKTARPNTIIVGGIAAQRLNSLEFNDLTHAKYSQSQTWAMAFDPAKYGIKTQNKSMIQCLVAQKLGEIDSTVSCPQGYDPVNASAYFPDITNTQYQVLLLSYAQKQIDLGADAIWIDMLYSQSSLIAQLKGNPYDPAVKTSYAASSGIIDKIHAYGETKYGKHIYVGTWASFASLPYSPPAIDFVTATPTAQEIKSGLNDRYWSNFKKSATNKLGNVPIYVFIDWDGSANVPMGVFSQNLTPAQQSAWIQNADAFFTQKGMTFVYPVHGGTFPLNSQRLSFGNFPTYDSLAPEFNTYPTIKALALKKSVS
jgi:hypothetical protein